MKFAENANGSRPKRMAIDLAYYIHEVKKAIKSSVQTKLLETMRLMNVCQCKRCTECSLWPGHKNIICAFSKKVNCPFLSLCHFLFLLLLTLLRTWLGRHAGVITKSVSLKVHLSWPRKQSLHSAVAHGIDKLQKKRDVYDRSRIELSFVFHFIDGDFVLLFFQQRRRCIHPFVQQGVRHRGNI